MYFVRLYTPWAAKQGAHYFRRTVDMAKESKISVTKPPRRKLKPFWRRLRNFFLWMILAAHVYLVLCKWMMPPVTLTQLGALVGGYGLKRDYVGNAELGKAMKYAAMASEDQLFPDHTGFDWKSIEKSLNSKPTKKNKKRGAGASTISQQVAKNVFFWQGGGIWRYLRKVPEAWFTLLIEWIWGKERIMEVYLNVIEMGPGIFGAEAAAQAYFKKPAALLSEREAALIVGCLPNPKAFSVQPPSRFVQWKSRFILRQMPHIKADPDARAIAEKN